MTTEVAVKSRDSERQPTATPAIISGVDRFVALARTLKQ